MNLLSVEKISKSFGIKTLFKELSFGIEEGQKIALVAKNGTGKSTLLRMLTGKDSPDSGRIVFRNQISVGYLEQEPEFDEKSTVLETIFNSNNPILRIIKEYEALLEEDPSSENHTVKLGEAMDKMEHHQAWDYDYKIHEIFSHLKITRLNQSVTTLSGGQRKRVALARVLIEEPMLLILDEPTNHLDVEMIEWLEEYLGRNDRTVFIVTHDRYFLDRICDEILELDQKVLYRYEGSYSYYVEKKAEREFTESRELDHTRNILRKELSWMRRQPSARRTKSKSRIDAFYDLKDKAAGKEAESELNLQVKMNRLGGKILELQNISKSYGEHAILRNFEYIFKKGERIGLVGPNGVGKSTLLNIITGAESPDAGKIEVGETIQYGYYSQKGISFKENQRVIDIVRDIAEVVPLADGSTLSASQFLSRFQFPPDAQHTPVYKLSGGEKRRLYLLTILIKNPNFLILDEPTNDLDLLTLSVLEDFLSNFPGCLIIVSHDRFFMDKLIDHLFVMDGDGEIKDVNGTYSEYREKLDSPDPKPIATPKVVVQSPVKKDKLSNKEKQEYQKLEKDIAKLESEKSDLNNSLNSNSSDYTQLQKWSERLANVLQELDKKSTRWLELSERA